MKILFQFACFICFIILPSCIFAQFIGDTATCIKGRVMDEWSKPIITGTVTAIIDTNRIQGQTDNDGYYVIRDIEAGLYRLKVSYLDCKTEKINKVIVRLGECTIVNVLLRFDPSYDYSKTKPYIRNVVK